MNKIIMCRLTKMRIMRSLTKSMWMDKCKYFPTIFQKSLKEIISNLDFEEKSKFPNDEESSWAEVKS